MISKNVYEYCCEDISKIENFEKAINDPIHKWHCHHRLETHTENGQLRIKAMSRKQLIEQSLYYKRPASELIFLTVSEHSVVHRMIDDFRKQQSNVMKRLYEEDKLSRIREKYTDEQKKTASKRMKKYFTEHPEAIEKRIQKLKGRKYTDEEYKAHTNQYEKRRGTHLSEETKRKISNGNKGTVHTEEYKQKMSERCKQVIHTKEWINKASEAHRGKKHDTTNLKWFTNGEINYRGAECPKGFRPGKINKTKSGGVGYHWYTNGKENIRAKECPEGFRIGRT